MKFKNQRPKFVHESVIDILKWTTRIHRCNSKFELHTRLDLIKTLPWTPLPLLIRSFYGVSPSLHHLPLPSVLASFLSSHFQTHRRLRHCCREETPKEEEEEAAAAAAARQWRWTALFLHLILPVHFRCIGNWEGAKIRLHGGTHGPCKEAQHCRRSWCNLWHGSCRAHPRAPLLPRSYRFPCVEWRYWRRGINLLLI